MRCAVDGRHDHHRCSAMEAAKAVDGVAGGVVGGAALGAEPADVSR